MSFTEPASFTGHSHWKGPTTAARKRSTVDLGFGIIRSRRVDSPLIHLPSTHCPPKLAKGSPMKRREGRGKLLLRPHKRMTNPLLPPVWTLLFFSIPPSLEFVSFFFFFGCSLVSFAHQLSLLHPRYLVPSFFGFRCQETERETPNHIRLIFTHQDVANRPP